MCENAAVRVVDGDVVGDGEGDGGVGGGERWKLDGGDGDSGGFGLE